ncbi:hypothetical protein FQP90_19605 [Paenarthrobacter nitroguajacolicus]|uniref:Uncharacterized protein n=1 Tax=Paenarthrobacter nitroguajacolicus TaxID=211146 RepID=A0A558GR47_PAENT|nr:hypothetical protein [Paenarthrobacter nitroguajacolicus]TVU59303.1 hypothetical protein FQP90_19605 [Paenarthrobacter nitroguajacolicus]
MKKAPKRVLASLGALLLPLVLLFTASSPHSVTEAAWQRDEVVRGSFGTITIPPATLNGPCEYHPVFLGVGAYVRVFWKPPAGYPNLTDTVMDVHLVTAGSTVTTLQGYPGPSNTTGSPAGYTTDIPATLLGGLLGFNTQFNIDIFTSANGWRSTPVSVRANAGILAGIGGSCTNVA